MCVCLCVCAYGYMCQMIRRADHQSLGSLGEQHQSLKNIRNDMGKGGLTERRIVHQISRKNALTLNCMCLILHCVCVCNLGVCVHFASVY